MHPSEFQNLMTTAILEHDVSKIATLSCLGAGSLKKHEAIEVYASGYSARLFEALGETYETVWKVLGDEDFHSLCLAYIERHPSKSRNLSDYGENFSEFIKSQLPKEVAGRLLVDLARFEWVFKDCFHSPYESSAVIPDLRNTEPDSLKFSVMRSLMVIRLDYPVYRLHGADGDLDQFNEVLESQSSTCLALYRTLSGVNTVVTSQPLHDFLCSVKECNFDLEVLADHCCDDPARAQEILHEIAKAGFLTGVEVSATSPGRRRN